MVKADKKTRDFNNHVKEQVLEGVLKKVPNPDKTPCLNGSPKISFHYCECCNTGGDYGLGAGALYKHINIDGHKKNRKEFLKGRTVSLAPIDGAPPSVLVGDLEKIIEDLRKDNEDLNVKLNLALQAQDKLNNRVEYLEQTPNIVLQEENTTLKEKYTKLEQVYMKLLLE